MNANVDLRQLAVRRDQNAGPAEHRSRRLWSRYMLPGTVIVGFLAVLAWGARDSLLPSQPVTVASVLTSRSELQQEGAPLFQAAGWVEPRPTPVLVTALGEGVVEQLLVVEGQEVQAGQPVARLVEADARLAVRAAEAELQLRTAELESAQTALQSARTNFDLPVHLQAASAEADAMLAQKETELGSLPFLLRSGESRLSLAQTTLNNLERLRNLGATPESSYLQAENELKSATAAVEELKQRSPRLKREIAALTTKRDALSKKLGLRTEETRLLGESSANLEMGKARVQLAEIALASARLRLERMTVRSPIKGRVLSLVAKPGFRLMGLAPGSLQESSTVVTLYDPAMLQVRADVRLDDVAAVRPGQLVRIETAAIAKGALEGEVLFATSQADIQKNTLQVKVAIKNPPPFLKPDMLVQVSFLAPHMPLAPPSDSEPLRLLVPRQLVLSTDAGASVWIADQDAKVARRRSITLGASAGDLVEVVDGLTPADRLIATGREGLRDGQRVTVTGEDAGVSMTQQRAGPKPSRLVPPPAGRDGHTSKR